MHNGQIGGYAGVRRALEAQLPERLYAARRGATDSELLFLLALARIWYSASTGAIASKDAAAAWAATASVPTWAAPPAPPAADLSKVTLRIGTYKGLWRPLITAAGLVQQSSGAMAALVLIGGFTALFGAAVMLTRARQAGNPSADQSGMAATGRLQKKLNRGCASPGRVPTGNSPIILRAAT